MLRRNTTPLGRHLSNNLNIMEITYITASLKDNIHMGQRLIFPDNHLVERILIENELICQRN